MKKIFIAALFGIFVTCCCYGQDVKVNINNNDATTTDDCAYRINGICSSEDIGGVDVELHNGEGEGKIFMKLTNYNSFPVTVLWSLKYIRNNDDRNGETKTGTTVLGVSGQKDVHISSYPYFTSYWSVEGMIVRKLAQ